MKSHVTTFLLGIIIGAVLGLGGSYLIGQRYDIRNQDSLTIKADRWTGKTWLMRYYENSNDKSRTFFWDPLTNGQERR
jgi:hypothetical protein